MKNLDAHFEKRARTIEQREIFMNRSFCVTIHPFSLLFCPFFPPLDLNKRYSLKNGLVFVRIIIRVDDSCCDLLPGLLLVVSVGVDVSLDSLHGTFQFCIAWMVMDCHSFNTLTQRVSSSFLTVLAVSPPSFPSILFCRILYPYTSSSGPVDLWLFDS